MKEALIDKGYNINNFFLSAKNNVKYQNTPTKLKKKNIEKSCPLQQPLGMMLAS